MHRFARRGSMKGLPMFDDFDSIQCEDFYGNEPEMEDMIDDEPWDGFRNDAEADADALADAGWGMDEDYGHFGYDDCPF